jgi:hypothetical protein
VPDELLALKTELAAAKSEIATLRMRLKNAELMYLYAACKQPAPKRAALRNVERN